MHWIPINQYDKCPFFQQPTWRLWGEESEKDVIFTVYLKKVRYHLPTPSASSVSYTISSIQCFIAMAMIFDFSIQLNSWPFFSFAGLGRWNIAPRMGNGSRPFCKGGHTATPRRSTVHRRWRAGEYVRQCVPGHLSHICPHRTNHRSAVAALRATARRTDGRRIICWAAQKEPNCCAACMARRLPGGLDSGESQENHCVHITAAVQFRGASQGVESTGAIGTGPGCCRLDNTMGQRIQRRFHATLQRALFDASIYVTIASTTGLSVPQHFR